jgi:hypothetical protein
MASSALLPETCTGPHMSLLQKRQTTNPAARLMTFQETRLDQMFFRIRHADIFEHIPLPISYPVWLIAPSLRPQINGFKIALRSLPKTKYVISPYHIEGRYEGTSAATAAR